MVHHLEPSLHVELELRLGFLLKCVTLWYSSSAERESQGKRKMQGQEEERTAGRH
jgi:hypothetical protein